MKSIRFPFIVLFFLFNSQQSIAADLVFDFGFSMGGEKLGTVYYTDGSSSSLNANQGIEMAMGIEFQHGSGKKFATQIAYGFTFGGAGTDGGLEWYNNNLQLVEFMRVSPNYRLGIGAVSQTSPKAYSYGSLAGSYEELFSDAVGYVVIAEMNSPRSLSGFTMGLKYTKIDYMTTTYNGVDVSNLGVMTDGSSFSLYLGRVW